MMKMKHSTTGLIVSAIAILFQSPATAEAAEIDFGKDIYPILAESCLRCHAAEYEDTRGRIKTPKGGLRLDTPEQIKAGFTDDDGKVHQVLVAGDAEASSLYTLTILPEDHNDVMPSSGDLLTKEQTDALKAWINAGANFGDFKAPVYVNPKSKDAAE